MVGGGADWGPLIVIPMELVKTVLKMLQNLRKDAQNVSAGGCSNNLKVAPAKLEQRCTYIYYVLLQPQKDLYPFESLFWD